MYLQLTEINNNYILKLSIIQIEFLFTSILSDMCYMWIRPMTAPHSSGYYLHFSEYLQKKFTDKLW